MVAPSSIELHPVTRRATQARLDAFVPLAGAGYAANRNADHGPGRHDAVSRLSAAIGRRTVSEAEVLAPIRARHGAASDSFTSEVFWRSYFKGWLEARPMVWHDLRRALERIDAGLAHGNGFAARHQAAVRGETGIDCFDHWIDELASTGYLHNWARMQFASIWIFTLGLPWELGARHFLDHLIDGDPASNTLSWRWVAGLHTRGKAYLADPARITRMTDGRFAPTGLATRPRIPDAPEAPPAQPPREAARPERGVPTLLWITPQDCSLETEAQMQELTAVAVAIIAAGDPAGPGAQADRIALDDALARAADHWNVPAARVEDAHALAALARECGARQVVTGRAAVGPGLEQVSAVRDALQQSEIALAEHVRAWDRRAWPHATRGFFGLRNHIPQLLAAAGLAD